MKEREQRLSLEQNLNLDQAGAGHSRWFMKRRARGLPQRLSHWHSNAIPTTGQNSRYIELLTISSLPMMGFEPGRVHIMKQTFSKGLYFYIHYPPSCL